MAHGEGWPRGRWRSRRTWGLLLGTEGEETDYPYLRGRLGPVERQSCCRGSRRMRTAPRIMRCDMGAAPFRRPVVRLAMSHLRESDIRSANPAASNGLGVLGRRQRGAVDEMRVDDLRPCDASRRGGQGDNALQLNTLANNLRNLAV